MVLLAIRVEMVVILKLNYLKFLANKKNEEICLRLVNGVITELLDPNVYYSRFSFMESAIPAIDAKRKLSLNQVKKSDGHRSNKFYTRSPLVKNLISTPSEGKVRALFTDGQSNPYIQQAPMLQRNYS